MTLTSRSRTRRPVSAGVVALGIAALGVVAVAGYFALSGGAGSPLGNSSCPGATLSKDQAKARELDLIGRTVAAGPPLAAVGAPQGSVTADSGPNGHCALVSQWQALGPVPGDAREGVVGAVTKAWTAAGLTGVTAIDGAAGTQVVRSVSGTSADGFSVVLAFFADGRSQVTTLSPKVKG